MCPFWTSATACSRFCATNGNTRLGGDDFDERIINYMAESFKKENGIDLKSDRMAYAALEGSR